MPTIRSAIAALTLCVVGLSFFAVATRDQLRARALDDHGVIVNADVVSVRDDRATDGGQRVTYRFAVGEASYQSSSGHLAHGDLVVARTLGHIEVRYLPEDPSVSVPTRAAAMRARVVEFFLAGTLTLSGCTLLAMLVRHRRKTGRWRR